MDISSFREGPFIDLYGVFKEAAVGVVFLLDSE